MRDWKNELETYEKSSPDFCCFLWKITSIAIFKDNYGFLFLRKTIFTSYIMKKSEIHVSNTKFCTPNVDIRGAINFIVETQ